MSGDGPEKQGVWEAASLGPDEALLSTAYILHIGSHTNVY